MSVTAIIIITALTTLTVLGLILVVIMPHVVHALAGPGTTYYYKTLEEGGKFEQCRMRSAADWFQEDPAAFALLCALSKSNNGLFSLREDYYKNRKAPTGACSGWGYAPWTQETAPRGSIVLTLKGGTKSEPRLFVPCPNEYGTRMFWRHGIMQLDVDQLFIGYNQVHLDGTRTPCGTKSRPKPPPSTERK